MRGNLGAQHILIRAGDDQINDYTESTYSAYQGCLDLLQRCVLPRRVLQPAKNIFHVAQTLDWTNYAPKKPLQPGRPGGWQTSLTFEPIVSSMQRSCSVHMYCRCRCICRKF
ncbi:hypothetical protein AA313_de0207988 [Arthrobotrys entomopaga]|nr:hypothetical protein AA313_de0207988 [Arthrobotrys entomopaga]